MQLGYFGADLGAVQAIFLAGFPVCVVQSGLEAFSGNTFHISPSFRELRGTVQRKPPDAMLGFNEEVASLRPDFAVFEGTSEYLTE